MRLDDLRTVKQVAEASPVFTESSLRWLIFNRQKTGFDQVLVKVGRRVFIDTGKLAEWMDQHRLGVAR